MQTRLEAPAQEPRNVLGPDGEIRLAGVSRAFARRHAAPVPALDGVTLPSPPARSSPSSGPSGCGKSTLLELVCGLQAPGRRHGAARARGAHAPARPAAAVADRARQRRARAARRRARAARQARERAHPLFAALRPRTASSAPGPHELSGGMRQRVAFAAHAARRQAGALPRRAVRRARRAHPPRDAGLARGRARRASRGRSCSSPTTSRRRRCSPTAIVVLSPRPGASSPSSPSALAAPARGHRPRARRAARARAGGAARDASPCCVLARARSARWELYAAPRRRRRPHPPRADARSPQALWDDRGLLWAQPRSSPRRRSASACSSRSSLGFGAGRRAALLADAAPRRSTRCSSPRRPCRS